MCNTLLCLIEVCTLYGLDKHIEITNVKFKKIYKIKKEDVKMNDRKEIRSIIQR